MITHPWVRRQLSVTTGMDTIPIVFLFIILLTDDRYVLFQVIKDDDKLLYSIILVPLHNTIFLNPSVRLLETGGLCITHSCCRLHRVLPSGAPVVTHTFLCRPSPSLLR